MSITRDHGEFVVECDAPHCHVTLETGARDFDGARDAMRNEQWITRKSHITNHEWKHFCSQECSDVYTLEHRE